jgi:hypothetical protein
MAAGKISRLAYNHGPNPELTNKAAAVPARRKCCHHDRLAVVAAPARITEGAGLRVSGSVSVLDPAVVAPAQQATGPVKQGSSDWYPTFFEA